MFPLSRAMRVCLSGAGFALFAALFVPSSASAEVFHCESTRTPNGSSKYCNFLLFDSNFSRHRQVVVAQGARRNIAINGRYDVFCVLVQDHNGVPNNIALRTKQCRKSHSGRNYQVAIKKYNLRRGRDGFSTNAPQIVRPVDRW
ncbi:hypothetical protein IWQ48_002215 [Labrenzia sp. EL_13]|nr:hypothetical protein [Labrenzia sp. EL_142]MBG6155404.1 hypothetical protein [Labrenzia sp. EL_162]MBG6193939.1 hypothetical protein [Labrenzia sp. EL_159]MBG6201086.1 hypothetical protein [Labrenzia sp. EL_13]